MESNYLLFYAEANIVCILIFGILLVNDRIKMNRQEKQVVFDHVLIAHTLYFISDVVWAGVIAGRVPRTHFSVVFVNFTNYILLSLIAYEWSLFAAVSEQLPKLETKRGKLLFRLPFAVMVVVMIVAYLIAPYFWVDAAGQLNGLYYPMMLAAPLIYVVSSCVQSLRQARRTNDPANRSLFLMIGLYPLAVVFFGIIQLVYLDAPLFCFGCTIMMLFFYIRSLEDQISVDPLTKLNNRGQLLRYVTQEGTHHREEIKAFVVMMDANDFKQINDTYGHAEGDRALLRIAEALRNCSKGMRYTPFLSRFGGDEFTLIVHAGQPAEVERLVEDIRCSLAESSAADRIPYQLSVSIGFDEWKTGTEKFLDCLQRADAKLYTEKQRRNQRSQTATSP